jgi:imidazolonepropionase-like amidohydrolase
MAGAAEPDTTIEQTQQRVAANARELLVAGVTTARDVSGPAGPLLAQRALCAEDPDAGPQLLLCCEGIACIDGHGTEFVGASVVTEIDSPESARAAVRQRKEIGADWIKVMLNGADQELELDHAQLSAIADEARRLAIPVAAHASNPKAVALAVACGVDSIEHGNDIDEATAAEMVARGITLVSTTHVYRQGAGCSHSHGGIDPLAAFEPRVQEKVRQIMSIRVAAHEKAIPAVVAAGTRVVLGTDSVVGPIGLAGDELVTLTRLGMSPMQALRAATSSGAELLGLLDRGKVEVGLRADLLVVRGRPDEDVETVTRPLLVLRGGVRVGARTRRAQ